MPGEDLEFKRKTLKRIQELQRQLAPSQATSKNEDSAAIEVDRMLQEEEEDKERDETHNPKISNSLFFMEPDHEGITDMEDQKVRDYWEAGVTSECLSALKSRHIDHSWVL